MKASLYSFLLIAFALASGCSKPGNVSAPVSPAPSVAESGGTAATEAEVLEFVKTMNEAVAEKDGAKISALLRVEDIGKRSLSDLGLPAKDMESVLRGFRQASSQNGLGQQIAKALKTEGEYKFLRIRKTDKEIVAIYRLSHPDEGLNYHEISVARHADGILAADDIYLLLTGEKLSQTFRRTIMPLVSKTNAGLFGSISDRDKAWVENYDKVNSAAKLLSTKDYTGALAIYQKLPSVLKDDKSICILHIRIAENLGDEELIKSVEHFQTLFPVDPAKDLISIDLYVTKKQYDKSLESINNLDRAVGGDPYLLVMAAGILVQAERLPEAATAAEKAIKADPLLADAYWTRINVSLKQKKFADTKNWLQKVVEKFNQEIEDLTQQEDYKEFAKSPEYQEFNKWYKARK